MQANTPEVGDYGDADNADQLPYYGTFGATDDFEYPAGAYGVMSWWDYGHWITVLAERPPHANPFQQNARSASSFLQASSEERGTAILEALPAVDNTGSIDELSTDELESVAANNTADGAGVRYVMIDDQTAARKFSAVTRWSVPPDNAEQLRSQGRGATPANNTGLYFDRTRYRLQNQNVSLPATSQRYGETMLSRLYFEDATGLSHFRLVHESSEYSIVAGRTNARGQPIAAGRVSQPAFNGWSQDAQNVSTTLDQAQRAGQALRAQSGFIYDGALESRVKVYERVPGATITGQAADTTNVSAFAAVQLRTDTGRTFTYLQSTTVGPDGTFEMTVPYATTNEVGPAEGGTNTSVVAVEDYAVSLRLPQTPQTPFQVPAEATANASVPESAVYDGETIDVGTLRLPEPEQSGQNSGESGDGSTGNQSGSVAPAPSVPSTAAPDGLSAPTTEVGAATAVAVDPR
jgi:dolichyl-diphosphooligosaccharide--protein glycosyltransferase